jgi:hypothetical protein
MNLLALPAWLVWPLMHLAAVLALLAGALLALGIFSARRGWEPRCRRCAHDLRSADPTTRSCPECGADLTRAHAVIGGSRRVRPIVTALGAVALSLAIAAAVWLDERGTARVRLWLAMRTPVADLVDSVFQQDEHAALAANALGELLGVANALSPQGGARMLPSGALLDGVVEAARRSELPSRTPMSAVFGRMQFPVDQLDDAEIARLVELAADELIASEGARSTLYRMAEIAAFGDGTVDVRAEVTARLQRTEEGRRALALRPTVDGPATSGRIARVSIASALDSLSARNGSFDHAEPSTLVLESAVLEPLEGGPPRALSVANGDAHFADGGGLQATLLLDAPPGGYRLRMRGVLAPAALLPSATPFPGRWESESAITPEAARALEGATEYEGSCELEVVEPALRERIFTDDDDAIAHAASAFARCAIRVIRGEKSLDYRMLGGAASADASIAMVVTVVQDDASEVVAEFSCGAGSFSASGGPLPARIDGARPFDLVLEPIGFRESTGSRALDDPRDGGSRSAIGVGVGPPAVWARFILRYPKATDTPEVVVERLPLEPGSITPRTDAATRAAVEAWVAGLQPASGRDRSPLPSRMKRSFSVLSARSPGSDRDSSRIRAPWPADLQLSGWLELASGDRLVGETIAWSGVPSASVRLPAMSAVTAIDDAAPVAIRYRPDARVLRVARREAADHLAIPFELVFPPEGGRIVLRWLDGE